MVDMVVDRRELRDTVGLLLAYTSDGR
jgi:hypothetical protein